MGTAWRWYLVGGGVLTVAHQVMPDSLARGLVHVLVGAAAVAAVVVGVRVHRPPSAAPWLLIAAGVAVWVLGDLAWVVQEQVVGSGSAPSVADLLYLLGYPVLAVGLHRLARARNPRGDRTALLDTFVIAIVVTLVMWVLVAEPAWMAAEGSTLNRVLLLAYPVGDVVLMVQLAHLSASSRVRRPALWFGGVALIVVLVADLLYQALPNVPALTGWTEALHGLYMLGYLLLGAAGLHPSMAPATGLQPPVPRVRALVTGQLVFLGVVVAAMPLTVLVELILGATPHVAEVAVAAFLVIIVVHVRMVRMTRHMSAQAERLALLAESDVLTGLANRRRFTAEVDAALAGRPAPYAADVPVFLVVLDRFTEINETLGHRVGDELLVAAAERMRACIGQDGLVGRLGGDSFGISLVGSATGPDDVLVRAAVVRESLAEPYELSDVTVTVDALVGVAIGPADGLDVEDLLQRADVALSVARDRPARVARYSGRMESRGALTPHLMSELGRALEAGEIVVHYQPQVQLDTGRVSGVEALVRWQHPEHGLLPPATFIPAAERTGMIGPLTAYVLDQALAQLSSWHTEGLDLRVAVNLSARNLLDRGFVDVVRKALDRHGVVEASLDLEITETMAMVDPNRSIEVLGALAEMGVVLSVDDYGTGYSSLAYLQRLPVGQLKIDRSFVARMTVDDASASIVRSTVDLARNLGMTVIAEGVEDDATLITLRGMRCDAAQGFGLGRPVPADRLPELVRVVEDRVPRALAQRVPAGMRMV